MNEQNVRTKIRREVLNLLKNNGKKSYRPKDISKQLGYKDNRIYRLFREELSELESEHLIGRAKGGRYAFKRQPTRVEGILRVNPQGFGFVEVEGFDEDLFVRESNQGNALDGDRVRVGLAAPQRGDRRREAEVLEVVERHRTQAVGTFKHLGHFAFVVPDDKRLTQDIYVPDASFNGATDKDKVVVSIDRFDDRKASPEGRILQVIGPADDAGVRVLSLAMSLDVKAAFPGPVTAEAEALPERIPKSEYQRRRDLRDLPIFTIDPVDAQDFDDAVHLIKLDDGSYELGVHIADVSHYVTPDSALDEEGLARGTSVYLVDRVIPMLPEKLSNRVCSLRPGEDKLTYSCIMNVTPQGRVKSYEIVESVIHSKQRFTYEEAQTLVDGGNPEHPMAATVVQAARLARTLTKKRMREGSVDFDLPEIRVVLDEKGIPVDIIRKERREANRLIEEFMLLANRTVAQAIAERRNAPPFVYRVHDRPDGERIRQLAEYVRAFGYELEITDDNVRSKQLNQLLRQVEDAPEAPVIEQAALRAMSKAKYGTDNLGHYGLGFRHYTHFTSPIRRYPDLMVHRLLKRYLDGGQPVDQAALDGRCQHCSEREVVAVQAERESVRLKQVEYIRQHLGDEFDGVVSGVTKFGVFIELSDLLVEGMVHVRDMDDDYYEYDERRYQLVGQASGKRFRPGDAVRVQVAGANLESREVDLIFVD